jgi:pimeloyl-ACP methyl ester carboxylesterase
MSILEQTSAIEINNTRISYSVSGKGETILFLHGNPGSRKDFTTVCEKVAEKGFKCIFIDRPGHMNSEEIIYDKPDPWYEIDLYSRLIDRLADQKTWIVGYSLGCFTAAKIAIKHPEKVKGLIFLAPYLIPDNKNEKPSGIPGLAKGAILGTLLGALLPALSQSKMEKHLEKVYAPDRLPDSYLETWLPRYTRFESLLAMMNDKNMMLEILDEVHGKLDEIKCPVRVLAGREDKVCSSENQVELVKEKIKNAEIKVLPDTGHGLPLVKPEESADFIVQSVK